MSSFFYPHWDRPLEVAQAIASFGSDDLWKHYHVHLLPDLRTNVAADFPLQPQAQGLA